MVARGWGRTFDDPIPLPSGGELRTLRDAGNFIAKLPMREHDAPAWLAAIPALMLVVAHGGDTMLPRIGIKRALYPHEPAPTKPRMKAARRYKVVSFGLIHAKVENDEARSPSRPECFVPVGKSI